MSQIATKQSSDRGTVESQWKDLFSIAGVSTLIMVALIPLQIIAYIIWQTPETAIESFMLFQENNLYGLLALELPYLVSNVLSVPLYLALFIALRKGNQSVMAVATVLGLIAIAVVFAARPTFDMLHLSNQYAAASTDVQRALFLAAGEAKLALMYGTAQQVHYVIGSAALLIISIVMLRSEIFSKTTAWMGVTANILVFGLYVPTIGIYLSIISVLPFLTIWLIMIGWRFLQLGRSGRKDTARSVDTLPEVY